MRFAFVEEHRHPLPVNHLCQIMGGSPRGYQAWRSRPAIQRQRTDMVLLAHIRADRPNQKWAGDIAFDWKISTGSSSPTVSL